MPHSVHLAEARVLSKAMPAKYPDHNWRRGFAWTTMYDSLMRHLGAWLDGEDYDAETGELHLAHARANIGFLLEHQLKGLGKDDRFKPA